MAVSRFESWLQQAGLELEVCHFPQGTRTAQDAAAAIGCEVGQIVKSLVFQVAGRPIVALVSGSNRVDLTQLATAAGGKVERADAELARTATGYAIGGVPPFGHASELPVFLDQDLLRYELIWAAAGRPDAVFAITPQRLQELAQATVVSLA
ncbi:MAG: YbaK/EbsC family protein [Candidatus Dormibacter sp.]|uniref:YbaK/EbsC family protein n=1 Tax=Candidatus Dormibacter sp. TaxID=2973982 RepID=UPI003D9ACB3D